MAATKATKWLILEADQALEISGGIVTGMGGSTWRVCQNCEVTNMAEARRWVKNNGVDGTEYLVVTQRARLRCAVKEIKKAVTVCEDVCVEGGAE